MQKLVWQNSNGNEIDLTSGNYGITNWEGFSNTELNIQSQQVPFQDGGVFLDALMEQRELSVTLAMNDGGNLETRYRLRRELIHALNPKLGEGYLIYTNDFISKRIKCVAQIPLFETHNSNDAGTPKASLAWTACEPYWEDLEETTVELNKWEAQNIINNGDVDVPIELTISTSNITNPVIINRTLKKQIRLNTTQLNDILIDTRTGQKGVYKTKALYKILAGFVPNDCCEHNGTIVLVGKGIVVINIYGEVYSLTTTFELYRVKFINGGWYAVGQQETVAKSNDAINWDIASYGGTAQYLYDIECNNSKIVACGSGERIPILSWDLDGSNFYDNNYYGVTGSNRILVKDNVFYIYDNNTTKVLVTEDGRTITETTRNQRDINPITIENGSYIGVYNSAIYKSTDCLNWTLDYTSTDVTNMFIIRKFETKYLAMGSSGGVLQSEDLTTWIYLGSANTTSKVVLFNAGNYSIYNSQGNIYQKDSGTNWTLKEQLNNNYYDVLFFNGDYILAGFDSILSKGVIRKTKDFKTYVTLLETTDTIYCIEYINNQFVAGSSTGKVYTSTNLESWESIQTDLNTIRQIIYNSEHTEYVCSNFSGSVVIGNSLDNLELVSNAIQGLSQITSLEGVYYCIRRTENETEQYGIYATTNFIDFEEYYAFDASSSSTVPRVLGVYNNNLFCIEEIWSYQFMFADLFIFNNTENPIRKVLKLAPRNYYVKDNILYLACNGGFCTYANGSITNELISGNFIAIIYETLFILIGENGVMVSVDKIQEYINLIDTLSSDSDMNFKLKIGDNEILFGCDSGDAVATLTYRQKYIGV